MWHTGGFAWSGVGAVGNEVRVVSYRAVEIDIQHSHRDFFRGR